MEEPTEIELQSQKTFAPLVDELSAIDSSVVAKLTTFPSGAVDIGIHVRQRFFVLNFVPGQPEFSFGIVEVMNGDGFNMGFDFLYHDFSSAKQKLIELVRSAVTVHSHTTT